MNEPVSERQVLGVWTFPRSTDFAAMVIVAQDRLEPPDFEVVRF